MKMEAPISSETSVTIYKSARHHKTVIFSSCTVNVANGAVYKTALHTIHMVMSAVRFVSRKRIFKITQSFCVSVGPDSARSGICIANV
jgi:hypothetical protein